MSAGLAQDKDGETQLPALRNGLVPHLAIHPTGAYQTWCREALEAEEKRVLWFIEYWEKRNPRLIQRAETQLGAIWRQKRHAG